MMTKAFSIDYCSSFILGSNNKPELSSLPMMFRRRLSSLGKMAFSTFVELANGEDLSQFSAVFVSRFAEMDMSLKMIETMHETEQISPAKFSTSVHNSLAGQFSVFYKNQQSIKALSAGPYSLANGLVEALTLATISQPKVLLNASDNQHPELYAKYVDLPLSQSSMSFIINGNKPEIFWEIEYGETDVEGGWLDFYVFAESKAKEASCCLPLNDNSILRLWR